MQLYLHYLLEWLNLSRHKIIRDSLRHLFLPRIGNLNCIIINVWMRPHLRANSTLVCNKKCSDFYLEPVPLKNAHHLTHVIRAPSFRVEMKSLWVMRISKITIMYLWRLIKGKCTHFLQEIYSRHMLSWLNLIIRWLIWKLTQDLRLCSSLSMEKYMDRDTG